ncbi:MAG: sensor domain-containing diguanylate cyclase [Candidatus Solibacter usitatus]|nr:sensor domain-containing diguanylate cyclase [Candidatus Solibacter usitatus]
MMRLTRRVFTDLAIWMTGLGLVMGIVFPFFVAGMGVEPEYVLTPAFFGACMAAGFIVGGANIVLARMVVGRRLRLLAGGMRHVEGMVREAARSGDMGQCSPETCFLEVDSEDEIGESGRAFNVLVEALALSLRTNASVKSFTEMLASQLELDPLANQALEQLLRHSGAEAGAILVASEGYMKVIASHGIRAADSLVESDHIRRALSALQRQSLSMPEGIALDGVVTDFRPREVLVDPLCYKRVPLGAVILASAAGFTDEARSRLELLREGLSLALNNALAHDRLQRLAAVDPLTASYNRRFGLARLREEFGRAVRSSTPLGVVMFDIDHFKSVNDTYGHLVGDRVLIRVAKVARSAMREGDILVRYGGEEFVAVLPGASREDIRLTCERLRRAVEETSIAEHDQVIRVTVSLGGISFPEFDVQGEEELIRRADEALYSAKESGRNRVVVA